jgi:hypothetical protein
MTVSDKWEAEYQKLVEFISENPDIKITENSISIPGRVREDFYRLFDAVRTTLAQEKAPQAVKNNEALCRNFLNLGQKMISGLDIEKILLPPIYESFVSNPALGLTRDLFDPLFNLLKRKISDSQFEAAGIDSIKNTALSMQQFSYDLCVLLALVDLCDADEVYEVPARKLGPNLEVRSTNKIVEPLPEPFRSRTLSFKTVPYPVFVIPQVLMHSRRLGRYFSARIGLEIPKRYCDEMYGVRDEIPITRLDLWKNGAILFYLDDTPKRLAVAADGGHLYRPDLLLINKSDNEWEDPQAVGLINAQNGKIQPRLGTYLVCMEPVPEQISEKLDRNIRVIPAGLEQAGLSPILDTLITAQKENHARSNA